MSGHANRWKIHARWCYPVPRTCMEPEVNYSSVSVLLHARREDSDALQLVQENAQRLTGMPFRNQARHKTRPADSDRTDWTLRLDNCHWRNDIGTSSGWIHLINRCRLPRHSSPSS
jgi:hypothetical protein